MNPTRIQRRRTRGFRLPPRTICATRGTEFGNPFRVGGWFKWGGFGRGGWPDAAMMFVRCLFGPEPGFTKIEDAATAVEWYRELRRRHPLTSDQIARLRAADHVACYCKPGAPCHVDVLLEIVKP